MLWQPLDMLYFIVGCGLLLWRTVFSPFLFVYFVRRMTIVYCASYYFWELRDRKGKSRSHLSSADSTNRWFLKLLVFDRNDFKNFRFVVVDLVCMFNLSLLVTALATTTILLRLKSPANSGKRNLQHGKNRHWIWKVVGFWCIQVCWFLFFRIDINVC